MDDTQAPDRWAAVLLELGEPAWDPQFLHDEWSQVVLGQAITSRDEYFRARRVGRGRTLNRAQRADIWRLIEQFTARLAADNMWTFRQVAARAARIEEDRAQRGDYRYRHVVVDEAQDLSPAHWRLLRALVAPGSNDLFLAGDTHQRIYDNYVSLGSLGINIRGRSTRLTLSYRSTHEILTAAEALLGSASWDDLDGGTDTLDGYRSVLHGSSPVLRGYPTWKDERDGIVGQAAAWLPARDGVPSIGIAVPSRDQVEEVEKDLTDHGIDAAAIGADGPRKPDVVHVGTLHRFKGLEYQHMLIAGVSAGAVPAPRVAQLKATDPLGYDHALQQARSLLFVAVTRARDAVTITWHGHPSPLLPSRPGA
jgi:superfamily I DNA/RNA helicase